MNKFYLNLTAALLLGSASVYSQNLSGFKAGNKNSQQQTEAKFDALISSENIGKTIKELTLKPHYL